MIKKQKRFLDVVLAMSSDNFFAKNGWDDMKWTGSDDKLLFKALTMYDNTTLLCGPKTVEAMPPLKHRNVRVVRTQASNFYPASEWLFYRELTFKDLKSMCEIRKNHMFQVFLLGGRGGGDGG